MTRSRTQRFLVTAITPDGANRRPDDLIVEEPMTIQLDGHLVATTMRTPGHDFELAVGFCHTDGLLDGAPVSGVRYCAAGSAVDTQFNVVTVDTGGRAAVPTPRLATASSSCGWCGSEQLEELSQRLSPLPASEPIALDVLQGMPALVAARQQLFDATGAVHAAAAFDATATLSVVREDVGRHNAVDKVVGAMLLAGAPAGHRPAVCSSAAEPASRWSRRPGRPASARCRRERADRARRRGRPSGGLCSSVSSATTGFNVYAPERWRPLTVPTRR